MDNATFLFTDVEGSTTLWEHHPAEMSAALLRHFEILQSVVCERGGKIFKNVGDGICAAFGRPGDAVDAAAAIQRCFATEDWPTPSPLRLRVALHTGEAVHRDGDYYGTELSRISRLLELAQGGHVLVSGATEALLGEAHVAGIYLIDTGFHRLRDLQRPERVFQLCDNDLPVGAPLLKATESLPNNLPGDLTSFVGRERELSDIATLSEKSRLITLVGAGGCGKTRLALKAAANRIPWEPDGAWFIELAPASDETDVPGLVAKGLGLQTGPRAADDTLEEFLRSRTILLILDNCEHVRGAVATLADRLLKSCPGLHVLATSRAAIGLGGESVYRVPSLTSPTVNQCVGAEAASNFEAIRLFVERAEATDPSFRLTGQNVASVCKLCARLDGIPMAIELAAARVKSLSVEQIESRLSDRFRLLTGGSRAALPRHQTLRALIDWSYDLLNKPAKVLLQRLGIFVGGLSLEAAESICGYEPLNRSDILDLIGDLADQSLVFGEHSEGEVRYRLLETMRQYARERMFEAGLEGVAELRARHARFFVEVAEDAQDVLVGRNAPAAFRKMDQEHDNIRAALDWFAESPDGAEPGLRLAAALQRYWITRGFLQEGWNLASRALDYPGATSAEFRTPALFSAAFCAMGLGERAEAVVLLEEALQAAQDSGDKLQQARALSGLAGIAGDHDSDFHRSRKLNEAALTLFVESGHSLGEAATYHNLADLIMRQDPRHEPEHPSAEAMAEARANFEKSLLVFQRLSDPKYEGICLNGLGVIASHLNDLDAALPNFLGALSRFVDVGDTVWSGNLCKSLSALAWRVGARSEAVLLAGAGEAFHEHCGFVSPVNETEWWGARLDEMKREMRADEFGPLLTRGGQMDSRQALAVAQTLNRSATD